MASNGLDKFPASFNFKAAQSRVGKARIDEQASNARAYIMTKYNEALNKNRSYFSITLIDTEYCADARVVVIRELLQAFPDIGYNPKTVEPPKPIETPQERAYKTLMSEVQAATNSNRLSPQEQAYAALLQGLCEERLGKTCPTHATPAKKTVTRLNHPDQAADSIHFFIALTDETARKLETYQW